MEDFGPGDDHYRADDEAYHPCALHGQVLLDREVHEELYTRCIDDDALQQKPAC